MSETPLGYLLSDDLIFASRIEGTARDLGFRVQTARSAAAVQVLLDRQVPRGLIVDLANPGLAIADVVDWAKGQGSVFVVAYGSHVDTATLKAAREAGCDLVLPRSKFVEDLPTALPAWLAGGTS